jgi:hypothetical protein
MDRREGVADAFEGVWCRGEEQNVIRGEKLRWADGSNSMVSHLMPGAIRVQSQGLASSFEAQLSPDGQQLMWSNGSVWTRSQPLSEIHVDTCESTDQEKLLEYLVQLDREDVGTHRVLYVVNEWFLGGVIPLEHHGLILELEKGHGFLTLNFGTSGISWQRSKEQPEFPEGTKFVKSHNVHLDPGMVLKYCAQTREFSVFGYDCKAWAAGMMKELRATSTKHRYLAVPHQCKAGAPALMCGFGGPLHAWL